MRAAEIVWALVILAWGTLMLREALRLDVGWGASGPGAGFFPFWLALGVMLSALAIVVRGLGTRPRRSEPFLPPGALGPLLQVVLPVAGTMLAMEVVGFYVASALYLAVSMRWIGRLGWRPTLLVSVAFPLAVRLVIERWFLVPLPKGYFAIPLPF